MSLYLNALGMVCPLGSTHEAIRARLLAGHRGLRGHSQHRQLRPVLQHGGRIAIEHRPCLLHVAGFCEAPHAQRLG